MAKFKDITNKRFGRLITIKPTNQRKQGSVVWECLCDCGNTAHTSANNLTTGGTKSCGCILKENMRKKSLPRGEAAFNHLADKYKRAAKERCIEFNLTKEQFKELTSQNCYYCDREPEQILKGARYNGAYTYNGVDRADNSKGYEIENCVPCCKLCNRIKGARTMDEFLSWITEVYNNMSLGTLYVNS